MHRDRKLKMTARLVLLFAGQSNFDTTANVS